MKFRIAFIIVATMSFFSTCTYDAYNPDICFQENILPIFVTKCSYSGCHNAIDYKAHYDLSNYDGIMKGIVPRHPLLSRNYTTIIGKNPSMPIGGKLSSLEVSYIQIWIKMGAPNSTNCLISCDTSSFSYSGIIQPLISTWCVGCHNSSNAGGGYDLSNYSGVKTSIVNGRLLGTFKHDEGFSPMTKNTDKLRYCNIVKVE